MATRIVLGGGLGGLTAAKFLRSAFPDDKVRLLEASNRIGGYIKSTRLEDNTIFEQGPRTIRPKGEAAEETLKLIEELELQNEIIPINSKHPAATNRMIYVNGKLHLLPTKFTSLFKKQAPFSKPLIAYLLNDIFFNNKKQGINKNKKEDDSIYEFTHRRFGKEVADYLISPVICGICAGNAKEISVKFLMERLFAYEQKYGSITSGIISNLFKGDSSKEPKLSSQTSFLVKRARQEGWAVYSFKNGLETLPITLEKYLTEIGVKLQLNTSVKELNLSPNEVNLKMEDGQELSATHLISSIPAQNLAGLLENQHPNLANQLNQIPRVSVAVVNLKYSGNLIKNDAFGFLTPPSEKVPILGVIYDSCCFPKSSNSTILTVMMGGYWFKKYFGTNPSEDYLFQVATKQLNSILGIDQTPTKYKVNILHNCIPQYLVGHQSNVQNIEKYIKNYKLPLSICGSSFYGVGINDVILGARKAIDSLKK